MGLMENVTTTFFSWKNANYNPTRNVVTDNACFFFKVPKMSKQVMRVRLVKKDSSLDLNDPVVMEDILKQVIDIWPYIKIDKMFYMIEQTT